MSDNKTYKLAFSAVLLATAIALHVVENSLPVPQNIPGMKLGLSNIVTIITLFTMTRKESVLFIVLRTMITTLFYNGPTAFLFSLTGALLSFIVMISIIQFLPNQFSIISMSIVGAIAHNFGQVLLSSLLLKNMALLGYYPFIMLSAIGSGFFTGIISERILDFLRSRKALKDENKFIILRKRKKDI